MIFRRTAGILLAIGALGACNDSNSPPSVVYEIAKQGGDEQQAAARSTLALPLQVKVKDPSGEAVSGVSVIFRPAQGVSLSDTVQTSGVDGIARVDVRVGSQEGTYTIASAFVRGRQDETVVFSATVGPGASLLSASKTSVRAGDTLTLTGANFNTNVAGNSVYFASARGRVLRATATSLDVVVPPCVASGSVAIRVEAGSATSNEIAVTYVATSPTLTLAVNEAITISGTELGNCLRLAGNGAGYLIVPQFATGSVDLASTPYTLGNTTASAQMVSAELDQMTQAGASTLQQRFDLSLRAMERRLPPPAPRSGTERVSLEALTVNSTRTFRVLCTLKAGESCFKTVTARLKYVGDNVLVYLDDAAPANGFTDTDLDAFGRIFDRDLYPIDTKVFGAESDLDGNGAVIMLLTPVVNALSPKATCATEGQVLGFFFGFDLSSRGSNSNKGEIFYGFVPDPKGDVSCPQSLASVKRVLPGTFIHEFQHMISYNQHAIVRNGSQETDWLGEGLSHIAEELGSRYYEAKFPAPSGRTDPTQVFPDSSQGFIGEQLDNSYTFLASTAAHSVTLFETQDCCEERGASWLFLRWLGDLRDSTIYARLVQTSKTSVENVEAATGESFVSLFGDFAIALYTDSLPGVARSAIPPRNRFRSRNLRFLYNNLYRRNFVNGQPNARYPRSFPIQLKTLAFGQAINASLVPGSFDYYELQTPAGSTSAALRFSTPASAAFDPKLKAQVGIYRLR
ncbi:MAG: IPT/TIG domain-containing protein [Gemmatimonadaceae bacterium]